MVFSDWDLLTTIWLFHYLPDSTWAAENWEEIEVGKDCLTSKMKVNKMKSPTTMVTLYCKFKQHERHARVFQVKALRVIWDKYPRYSETNTIMFDDLRRNFLMNPANGLRIRPFKNAHSSRGTDRELVKLSAYLKRIAPLSSFDGLDHKHWESYLVNNGDTDAQ